VRRKADVDLQQDPPATRPPAVVVVVIGTADEPGKRTLSF
jgi:hypothetical protein